MLGWLTRKRKQAAPTFHRKIIGELTVSSGSLLIADPMLMTRPVQVDGVPAGRHPIEAEIISYPEGGRHISSIHVQFRRGGDTRRELGKVLVDSAKVILVDS